MTNPSRSNPFATRTFTELCVMLNGEYHSENAYNESRIELILKEIIFRIKELKQLNILDREIENAYKKYIETKDQDKGKGETS